MTAAPDFKHVFSGGDGVVYAIRDNGELVWYHHEITADEVTGPRPVGVGGDFKHVFSGGDGIVYAIRDNGELLWYRHDGRSDGTFAWQGPTPVGDGWDFDLVFAAK